MKSKSFYWPDLFAQLSKIQKQQQQQPNAENCWVFFIYLSCGLCKQQLFFSPFSLVLNVPSTKCGQIKCRRFCTIVSRKRPRLGPAIQLTNTYYPYPRSDLPQSTSTWTDSGHEIRVRLAKKSYRKFRAKLCRLSCRRCRL